MSFLCKWVPDNMILNAEYSVKLGMYLLEQHPKVNSRTILNEYFLFEGSSPLHC